MLSASIKDFLYDGKGLDQTCEESSSSAVQAIRRRSQELIEQYSTEKRKIDSSAQDIKMLHARVREEQQRFNSNGVIDMLKQRKERELQIQLLQTQQLISKLDACDTSEMHLIPKLILEILESLPPYQLPAQSVTRQRARKTASSLASRLLQEYHKNFENHLNDTTSNSQSTIRASGQSQHQNVHMWASFLQESRKWLQAFTMASLLPVRLSESTTRALEVYQQDVLEEALLPMWGRFSFHLSAARDVLHEEQLIWSFGYAKSFAELLCDLCDQITSDGLLQCLCAGHYKAAGVRHVVEKVVRFLRLHAAGITFAYLTKRPGAIADSTLKNVIESSLDLDAYLVNLLNRDKSSEDEQRVGLMIATVFCDSPEILSLWVQTDLNHVQTALEPVYRWNTVFQHTCENPWIREEGDGAICSVTRRSESNGWCYRGLFESVAIFAAAVQRYHLLASVAQGVFAGAILEPLLVGMLGLLLIRISSSQGLSAMRSGQLHGHSNTRTRDRALQDEIEFAASVDYLEKSLRELSVSNSMCGSVARFRARLEGLTEWVPRGYFSQEESAMVRAEFEISPMSLLRKVFALPGGAGEAKDGGLQYVIDETRSYALSLAAAVRP